MTKLSKKYILKNVNNTFEIGRKSDIMKKKGNVILSMTILLAMMFSLVALAEYGVNENYTYHHKCLQNVTVTGINAGISTMFRPVTSGTADIHFDYGTISATGTLVQSVRICGSDGTLTSAQIYSEDIEVRGTSSYVDNREELVLSASAPYKIVVESDDGAIVKIVQAVANYN